MQLIPICNVFFTLISFMQYKMCILKYILLIFSVQMAAELSAMAIPKSKDQTESPV